MPAPTSDELKQFNQTLITEFRMNGGNVNGWDSLLLLTTLGAKSNQPHTTPLGYSTDGDRLIIVAAAEGKERERLFNQHVKQSPATLEYQEMVSRQFPVVILEPITGEPSWAAS